ncbi:MAG: ABC transporter permease subunit [Bryobacterales bacterium]|nr:ABC transporter permease subunit [Bryobacterales bacterium]
MSIVIARHELRSMLRDRALLCVLVIFLVALTGGLSVGTSTLHRFERVSDAVRVESDAYLARMRTQLEDVAAGRKPKGFFSANRPSALAFSAPRPPSPLMPLCIGQSEVLPVSARLSLFSAQSGLFDLGSIDNAEHQQIGRFDLGFVLVYLMPLMLIALSYNLLSGERERGTLPILMNQPVSPFGMLVAKAAVPLAMIAGPAVAIPILWTLVASPGSGELWGRLVLFALLVVGYGAFWLTLAVMVNLLGWRSSTNALALGGCWLLFVLVLPAALQTAGSVLYPMPSRMALITESRLAEVEASQRRQQLVDRFYRDHAELAPEGGAGQPNRTLAVYASFEETERAVQPVFLRFEQQLAAQQRLLGLLQYLSPAVVFREALTRVAATDAGAFAGYRDSVLTLRSELKDFLLPRVARGQMLTLADYDSAPRFRAASYTGGAGVSGALAGLILPTLLLALAAARSLARIEWTSSS